MFFSQQIIEHVFSSIFLLAAYVFSVPITEYVHAWFAKKLGDSAAQKHGWLTLNPANHVTLFGASFILLRFYTIRSIPLHNNSSHVKTLIIYLAASVIHILLALSAFLVYILIFGGLSLAHVDIIGFYCNPQYMSILYPNISNLMIILALFLARLVAYNLLIAALSFMISAVRYSFEDPSESYDPEKSTYLWVVTLICNILFVGYLNFFIIKMLTSITPFFMRLIGA